MKVGVFTTCRIKTFLTLVLPEERVKNFYYKVGLIEHYTNISVSLETGSSKTSLSVVFEKQRQLRKINEVKGQDLMGLKTSYIQIQVLFRIQKIQMVIF